MISYTISVIYSKLYMHRNGRRRRGDEGKNTRTKMASFFLSFLLSFFSSCVSTRFRRILLTLRCKGDAPPLCVVCSLVSLSAFNFMQLLAAQDAHTEWSQCDGRECECRIDRYGDGSAPTAAAADSIRKHGGGI